MIEIQQPDISKILTQLENGARFEPEKPMHESPLLRPWLNEHKGQIKDAYAEMAEIVQAHPELAHPDIRSGDATFIREEFPRLMQQFEDETGLRWDKAQRVLSVTGPTAYAGLTKHRDVAGKVGLTYADIVAQLDEAGKGTWIGAHNAIGKTPQELENRGYPFSVVGRTGSDMITGVHQMGFLPLSQSTQPVLEARIIL